MSLRAMKVLMLGKTQNIFGFSLAYSYLYVALRHEVRLHLNKKRNFFFVLSSICTNFAPKLKTSNGREQEIQANNRDFGTAIR